MPSHRANKRRKSRLSKKKKKAELCNGEECCQAITSDGTQCTRSAKFKAKMYNNKKLFGITIIPGIKCCRFCNQHLAMLAMSGFIYSWNSITDMVTREIQPDIFESPDDIDRRLKPVFEGKIFGIDPFEKISSFINRN